MITVYMVQTLPTRWRIESTKGHILQDDIFAYSIREAKEYVEKYISSWYDWTYELKLMEDPKNGNNKSSNH